MTEAHDPADVEEILAFWRQVGIGCQVTVEQLYTWCWMPRRMPKRRVNEIMKRLKDEDVIDAELVDKSTGMYQLNYLKGVE